MMNRMTSMIPKLLDAAPGRQILYEGGIFCLKEANGEDVKLAEMKLAENGRDYLVEPTADQIDVLMDAEQLAQEATLYRLPSKT